MPCNILIVEDQPLIAMTVEDAVAGAGHRPVGIAQNRAEAMSLARDIDVALVDVNLQDGPTGPEIAAILAQQDVVVLFMTSDPGALGAGVPGTVGVVQKPVLEADLAEVIQYAAAMRSGERHAKTPRCLKKFAQPATMEIH